MAAEPSDIVDLLRAADDAAALDGRVTKAACDRTLLIWAANEIEALRAGLNEVDGAERDPGAEADAAM